ncbi:RNA recognition motif-containing protein [Stagonosporopsis vannaccii]|nr:RNA recognition motif-containing protein [Stagonosporopsis vannaccii]
MPPLQGEVSLTTLFADVHYYFSPPAQQPPHHRFDKSSYVYLYHNPMRQNGRVEVANNPGTPAQDAFAGQLDTVKIEQNYKHPCLFTLTVDAFRGQAGSPASSPQQDVSQWHLPVPDPNNQGKYMYRIHTIDIYLWTANDASMFLDSLRRVVQPHQLQIIADPHAVTPTLPHHEHKNDTMSPLIANLERAAISHQSRTPSVGSTQAFPGPPQAAFPGPPAARTSTASPSAADPGYAPMAYNPAAPAAPEPIAHREKTPPPPDAASGTGLVGAAVHDSQPQQYSNPLQQSFTPQQTSGPYTPGPPAPGQGFSGPPGVPHTNATGSMPPPPQSPPSFAGPPQSPPSFAGPPQSAPPAETYHQTSPQQPGIQRQSSIPTQQYAGYNGTPGYTGGPQSPGLPAPGVHQAAQYLGYAQHPYGSTAQQAPGTNPADVHKQFYRPTEQEAGVTDHSTAAAPNSNMGKRVVKVEKGVGRFLKKLDSKCRLACSVRLVQAAPPPSHSGLMRLSPAALIPGSRLRQGEWQAALRLEAAPSSSHLHSARPLDAAAIWVRNCIVRVATPRNRETAPLTPGADTDTDTAAVAGLSTRAASLGFAMRLPTLDLHARAPALEKRISKQSKSFVIIAIIVVSVFTILVTTYLLTLRYRRPFSALRNADKPRDKLPSLFSWKRFRRGARHEYSSSLQDTEYRGPSVSGSTRDREMSGANDPERQSGTAGVDRNTSVRSVMTLPAYSRSVRENERVLGREGERAGMDNVVELPETQDEEETQRNEEMESLYQIRLARRAEAADREARRQARREARARGDHIALAEIRRRAEEAADLSVSQMLIAEHQGRNRDRRVSSVQYGDLGVARHDGTRVRANSHDSDNRPLLDNAASISGRSRGLTHTSTNTLDTHHRGLSVTSISRSSVDSRASADDSFPQTTTTTTTATTDAQSQSRSHSRSNSAYDMAAHTLPPASSAQHRSRSASPAAQNPSPHPAQDIPPPAEGEQAPAYEDPPDYTSPVDRRAPQLPQPSHAPQLPQLERLPSIRVVTTAPTPVDTEPPSSFR